MTTQISTYIIDHFGSKNQIIKCIEEMAELTKELCKEQTGVGVKIHIQEEIADCIIMLSQMKEIFGSQNVDYWISIKERRILNNIKDEKL